ncbi:MAG: XRE family transcriptional regulator [Fusicatenibacter sp.]|nr:XRE family transcriptional regulator [Fusicatenibacter sp.]
MEIGKKIRELRIGKGLTQEELADRCELSKGFISQIENDITSPSIATLVDILTCLGSDLTSFFSDRTDETVVFHEEDYFVKADEANGSQIAWLIPNAQKNRMEPIRLTLSPGGSTEPDPPHEGEEFGYVLQGKITIHLGNHLHKAKKGDCFYYEASCTHYLENKGKTPAVILWISSPPFF